jgi:hypothetical protein
MSGLLSSLGAVLILWAIVWYGFNHYANAITYLMFFGLVFLLIGWAI